MPALTFDQAMQRYVDGDVTAEQFFFVALGSIKKDIEEIKQRIKDKE
jgi:hypothetical protein